MDIDFDRIDLDQGQTLPPLKNYKALIVLGGPDSANDTTPKMMREMAYIKESLALGLAYLGICLGLQTLVKAAGGAVVAGDVKEIGFTDPKGKQYAVNLTNEGRSDPLFTDLPDVLDVFQLHGETVELAKEMTLLAAGQYCRNQVVKVTDKAYGIQSHFELTAEMLEVWATQDPDLLPVGRDKLLADFKAIESSYTPTGRALLTNFLRIAGLI